MLADVSDVLLELVFAVSDGSGDWRIVVRSLGSIVDKNGWKYGWC